MNRRKFSDDKDIDDDDEKDKKKSPENMNEKEDDFTSNPAKIQSVQQKVVSPVPAKNDNILDLLDMNEGEIKDVKTPNNIFELMEGNKPKPAPKETQKSANLFNNSNDLFGSSNSVQKLQQISSIVPMEVISFPYKT